MKSAKQKLEEFGFKPEPGDAKKQKLPAYQVRHMEHLQECLKISNAELKAALKEADRAGRELTKIRTQPFKAWVKIIFQDWFPGLSYRLERRKWDRET